MLRLPRPEPVGQERLPNTIKAAVGDTIPLKVAGGVRSLDTLLKMRDMGVSRFGIGYKSALHIMQEAEERGWV